MGNKILRPEHLQMLNQLIESTARTRQIIASCENCGIPAEQMRDENEQQSRIASRIKAEFFPDQV